MHIFFPKNNDWKKYLKQEIKTELTLTDDQIKSSNNLAMITLDSDRDLKNHYFGFALDILPHAQEITEGSIGEQAQSIVDLATGKNIQRLSYQVFGISQKFGIITNGRSELFAQKLGKLFRKSEIKHGRYHEKDSGLIKAVIMPDRTIRVSIFTVDEKQKLRHLLSPFPGGFTTIADDKKAPSRAFKKLIEAQQVLERKIQPNETLIDLGACPGGWSYVALNAGAKVSAIDRSELRQDLMPKVNFMAQDAFKYTLEEGYDWVVSDIICTPERILELIENWATRERCKNFVFTIKFKGEEDYPILQTFKKKLKTLPYHTVLRQLNVNKNEVMVMGKRERSL